MSEPKIKITKDGPYLVSGNIPLQKEISVADAIYPVRWEKGAAYEQKNQYSLCRCGKSSKMPYCDGAHLKTHFDGTETAGRKNYDEYAKKIVGPGIELRDAENLCAGARFCDADGGSWLLTERSDNETAKAKVIQQSCDCPSGRLVAIDKDTGKQIEPPFEKSISLTEDQTTETNGPLWVKGGIPIESTDGSTYEIRNRVTLCRCGKSRNKPFCDGTHLEDVSKI